MSDEGLRLAPFDDRLLVLERRGKALTFLIGLRLPSDRAVKVWARWCRYVGTAATRDEYHALELVAPDLSE